MTSVLRPMGRYVFLGIAAVLSVFPLYFMAVSATNTSQDVLASQLTPGGHLIDNIKGLFAMQDVGSAFYHSTVNAVVTTVFALIVSSIAGYGFEVYHSKAKDRLMWVLLLTIMIPFAATMIPLFQVFAKLGLVNSTLAVVLPVIATPFLVLMFRQTARSFPHEIIEAARMDGLGELSIFFRMFIPTMRSAYVAATVITFLAAWNNFLWPKVILLNNDYQTMPMLISNLLSGYVTDYGALMLAVLIASLPTIILFLLLQRSFVQGFTGAVK
ncbi:MAG: carbohydrate ABC transporter permease [Demequina sp.]|nr:carbohydrate ABC transporter permease [Demequina sp.]